MNETVDFLLSWVVRAQRVMERNDPDWAALDRELEELLGAFQQKHAGNRSLLREVDGLLDAAFGIGSRQGDQSFLLGLKMGLDLGRAAPPGQAEGILS